jgi:hypothetical protein
MTPKWYPINKGHLSLFCQQKSSLKTMETQFFDSDNESEVQDPTDSESTFSANETNN